MVIAEETTARVNPSNSASATLPDVRDYDAFISYSHRSDGDLAPALEVGLQQLAKPWNERRVMDVFLDRSDLSASPHLWSSIVVALDASKWFVLLASPESATSKWVGDEVTHWLSDPSCHERFLLVLTHGTIQWEGDGFTIDSDAVHPALQRAFAEEPNYVDMRLVDRTIPLDLRNPSFKDAVANLSASIRGTSVGDLIGEDTRQFRIARRVRRVAVTALAVLTIGAVVASVVALQQRSSAQAQRNEAVAEREAAEAATAEAERARAEAESNAAQARARELAALALDAQTSDPAIATLLAVEANYPNGAIEPIAVPEARSALGVTLRSAQGATVRRVRAAHHVAGHRHPGGHPGVHRDLRRREGHSRSRLQPAAARLLGSGHRRAHRVAPRCRGRGPAAAAVRREAVLLRRLRSDRGGHSPGVGAAHRRRRHRPAHRHRPSEWRGGRAAHHRR